jgi:hypothetical protein
MVRAVSVLVRRPTEYFSVQVGSAAAADLLALFSSTRKQCPVHTAHNITLQPKRILVRDLLSRILGTWDFWDIWFFSNLKFPA